MHARTIATAARSALRIGLIPADGIGREVIPVGEPRPKLDIRLWACIVGHEGHHGGGLGRAEGGVRGPFGWVRALPKDGVGAA
jgi:hypothetical protein